MTRHRFTVEVDSPADAALVAGHIQFTLGRWTNLEQVRVIPIPPVDADTIARLRAELAEVRDQADGAAYAGTDTHEAPRWPGDIPTPRETSA